MDIFKNFKQVLKIREVLLDNEVFQLHYRVTAILLLGCAALVASKQHFGDPIDCITRDDVPNKIMDTYCWIHSTFTLPDACNKTVGSEVAHPCVDKYSNNQREDRVYHKYYQWVYFVLFFQACGFYGPHFLWKAWESRLLRTLTIDLELKNPLASDGQQWATIKRISKYFVKNRERHERYFRLFTLCEVMNLFNVIIQIYLVDEFLGGTFTTYGLDVLDYVQLDQTDRIDPMVKVFPRMTKCTFHRFGSSGDVQRYDSLCILPLNIINEKIYIIMWFWFVFLAFVTTIWLVYRLATHLKPEVRFQVLRRRASLANESQMRYALQKLQPGDWFLLSMMCKNMDAHPFKMLIKDLAKTLQKLGHDQTRLGGLRNSSQNGRSQFSEKGRIIDDEDDSYSQNDELELEAGPHGQPLDDEVSSTQSDGKLEKIAIKS